MTKVGRLGWLRGRQTGKALAMTRGKRQGAARTTSKAMSWPAKAGWLASQYWAALTIRRRCFAVTVQAASSAVFRRFTSTKASRLPFSATRSISQLELRNAAPRCGGL
jgi:hypothetical protein